MLITVSSDAAEKRERPRMTENDHRMTREIAKKNLERAVTLFGLVSPMTAAPQLYQIWAQHQVGGLSSVTVGSALFMSLLWTTYGLLNRQAPIWMVNGVWAGLNGATLVGILQFAA